MPTISGVRPQSSAFIYSSPNIDGDKKISPLFVASNETSNSIKLEEVKSTSLNNNSTPTIINSPSSSTSHKEIRSFSIENLLAAPRVARGRRPNAKYPRVQACKSMSPFMFPLFPITQPAGVTIRDDENME